MIVQVREVVVVVKQARAGSSWSDRIERKVWLLGAEPARWGRGI